MCVIQRLKGSLNVVRSSWHLKEMKALVGILGSLKIKQDQDFGMFNNRVMSRIRKNMTEYNATCPAQPHPI